MKQLGKKFLVIEDREDVAENNCTFLQLVDPAAQCEIISSPKAARRSLTKNLPDLLIVDLLLNDKESIGLKTSGIAFLQYVLCNHPRLNILVYSTNTELVKHLLPSINKHQGGFSIVNKMELRTAFLAGAQAALSGKRTPASFVSEAY